MWGQVRQQKPDNCARWGLCGFKCHRPNGSSVGSRLQGGGLEDTFAMTRYGQDQGPNNAQPEKRGCEEAGTAGTKDRQYCGSFKDSPEQKAPGRAPLTGAVWEESPWAGADSVRGVPGHLALFLRALGESRLQKGHM